MKIKGKEFTIGADPELFIGKEGVVASAFGLIKGDKQNPHPVKNGAVQVDGMALEFNIDPASDLKGFQRNLGSVLKQMMKMVPEYGIVPNASVVFGDDIIKAQPEEALELGCEPDFNGYSSGPNPTPNGDGNMRTAGGHIHIGGFFAEDPMEETHFKTCQRLARILDEELGIYSILWDTDDKRRSMYGKATCFRPKTYGMEYRTLSNSWLFSKGRQRFVYNAVRRSLVRMFDQDDCVNEDVVKIIDDSLRFDWRLRHGDPLSDEARGLKHLDLPKKQVQMIHWKEAKVNSEPLDLGEVAEYVN